MFGKYFGNQDFFLHVPHIFIVTSLPIGAILVGYRILYFYKKENTFYKNAGTVKNAKNIRNIGSAKNTKNMRNEGNISFVEKELWQQDKEELSVKLFYCALPEYYGSRIKWGGFAKGKRSIPIPWNFGQLLRLMQNCCEYVSADAYYLEEGFEKELTEGEFGFTPGRQRMCGEMMKKLSGQFREIDSILYLAESREEQKELPLQDCLLRKLHYFFYMGEKTEVYDILEANLWDEYGMPVISMEKIKELAACQIRRLLVLDDRQEGAAPWEALPKGCVYLDFWSLPERRKEISKNRGDIKYVSEYLYLLQNLDMP